MFDRVAEAYPLDKEAVFYAGDARFHSQDRFSAVPYFERALQLDSGYTLVKGHMAGLMATMGPTPTQLECRSAGGRAGKRARDGARLREGVAHGRARG